MLVHRFVRFILSYEIAILLDTVHRIMHDSVISMLVMVHVMVVLVIIWNDTHRLKIILLADHLMLSLLLELLLLGLFLLLLMRGR